VPTRLILVSHAPTTATRAAAFPVDEPLDPHGLADATAAAGALRRVDTVLCAPARRCTQTAAALGLRPTIDEGLRDGDLGRWAGRTLDDVAGTEPEAVAAWLGDPGSAPHGGESLHDLLARAGGWLDDVPAGARSVVAVTHPMLIRAIIVTAIAATPASFWRIDVSPLTQTTLSGGPHRWSLRGTGTPLTP
jgi:broad specificity phosphatase PhoE